MLVVTPPLTEMKPPSTLVLWFENGLVVTILDQCSEQHRLIRPVFKSTVDERGRG